MKIIAVITEKTNPSQELIEKVRNLHQSSADDVRVLIPIINSLTKKEVLGALPKILKLSPNIVKDVLLRLMGVGLDHKVIANLPGEDNNFENRFPV
jgi:symplekin